MSGFKVNFSVNNQLATPSMHAAALVNRPAAGQPGRVFIDTNNPSTGMYRDTGTVWIQIASTSSPEADTLQTVTDRGNTTDNTLILTYDSLFNGSNAIEFFDTGTTATRYSITKQGTGNRLTLQGNSPLSTNDMGLMIDAPNNTLRTYWGSSFNTRGISCDFTNNIYRLGNISGTAGQQGIYIDANGNVGIGTTSPTATYKLDLEGNFRITGQQYFFTSTSNGVLMSASGGNFGTISFGSVGYGGTGFSVAPYYGASRAWVTGPSATYEFTYNTHLGVFNKDFVQYNNLGNVQFYIKNSNGNVIIGNGTTDAGYKLDCTGTSRLQGGSAVASVIENSGTNAGLRITNSTYPYIVFNRAGTVAKSFGIFNATGDMAIQESTGWSGANSHIFYGGGGFSTIGSGTFGNNVAANASAVLEATSTTKGFLPPRMTNAQMTAIVSPATGLMVYDTTNSRLNVYDGSNWISLH